MPASFIIGFHSRRADNLFQTLRLLKKRDLNTIKDCQIVTLCQDKLSNYIFYESILEICGLFQSHAHFDLELTNMHLPKITNLGVEKACHEKIIILESDRVLPEGYFERVISQLEQGRQITCRHMRKLTKETPDNDLELGLFESTCDDRNPGNEIGVKNIWSGNTAICKSDYYKAGKMDEKYIGYGWADSDMTHATEAAGIQSVFVEETELHLWHPGATYGEGNQKELFINNGLYFCKKWRRPYNSWFANELMKERKILI